MSNFNRRYNSRQNMNPYNTNQFFDPQYFNPGVPAFNYQLQVYANHQTTTNYNVNYSYMPQYEPYAQLEGVNSDNIPPPRSSNRGRASRNGSGRGRRFGNPNRNFNGSRESASNSRVDGYTSKVESRGDLKKNKIMGNKVNSSHSIDIDSTDIENGSNDMGVDNSSETDIINQRDTLEKQLCGGTYECMICYNTIRRQVAVWSCNNCFHVFHLFCIKKWSQSMKVGVAPISPLATELARTGHKVWRCPACQKEHTSPTFLYVCFCGKTKEPEHSTQLTPHTCGEMCGKPRGENCPHKCLLMCHPGPCPPCESFTQRSCQCGKTSTSSKCGSSAPISCGQVCGNLRNCKTHSCDKVCHSDLCEQCDIELDIACHCGAQSRTVCCGSAEANAGVFSCAGVCNRNLECGHHTCKEVCHSGTCPPCSRDPNTVVTCPCGRVPIGQLLPDSQRQLCIDPIPTCNSGSPCDRSLKCGHTCPAPCHDGPCPPCKEVRNVSCRCGKSHKDVSCAEWDPGKAGEFTCQRRCRKKKTCGRCRCNEVCCIDFDHACVAVCAKTLTCGKHTCEHTCHLGRCPPCERMELSEVGCNCGAVILPPPVSCGTPPPECHHPCTRDHPCQHPVRHKCHAEASCPPCTVLVSKVCLGGHTERQNIPCHQRSVTCGQRCELPIDGCQHLCARLCHDGPCIQEGKSCNQPCPIPREECGHPCGMACHVGEPCPIGSCNQNVTVNCACGLRKKVVSCHSLTTMNKWELWGALQGSQNSSASIDVDQLSKKTRQLECDSLCSQVERNRAFAEALNIDADPMPTLGPPSYSRWLRDFARSNFDFANNVEKSLDELMRTTKSSKHKIRSHSFQPMNRDKRRFVHELAEFYMCDTQSYDAEPNRSVVVMGKKDRSRTPSVRLSSVVQEEINTDAKLSGRRLTNNYVIRPPVPTSSSSSSFKVLGKVPSATKEIDYFSD